MSLWRSQSYLGNYYRRKRAKNGAPSAITDTAHKLALIIYHLVKTGKQFDESVFNAQEEAHQKRALVSLNKRLKKHGVSAGSVLEPTSCYLEEAEKSAFVPTANQEKCCFKECLCHYMTLDERYQVASYFFKHQIWCNGQLCEVFGKMVFTLENHSSIRIKSRYNYMHELNATKKITKYTTRNCNKILSKHLLHRSSRLQINSIEVF